MSTNTGGIIANLRTVRNTLIGGIAGLGVGTIGGSVIGTAVGAVLGAIGGGVLGLVLSGPYGAYAIGEIGAKFGATLGGMIGMGSLGIIGTTLGVKRGYSLNKSKIDITYKIDKEAILKTKVVSKSKDKTNEIETVDLKNDRSNKVNKIQNDLSNINTNSHNKLKLRPVSRYQTSKNVSRKDKNNITEFLKK